MWNPRATLTERINEIHHQLALIALMHQINPKHPNLDTQLYKLRAMSPEDHDEMQDAITYGSQGGVPGLLMRLRQRDAVFLTGAWCGDANTGSAAA